MAPSDETDSVLMLHRNLSLRMEDDDGRAGVLEHWSKMVGDGRVKGEEGTRGKHRPGVRGAALSAYLRPATI